MPRLFLWHIQILLRSVKHSHKSWQVPRELSTGRWIWLEYRWRLQCRSFHFWMVGVNHTYEWSTLWYFLGHTACAVCFIWFGFSIRSLLPCLGSPDLFSQCVFLKKLRFRREGFRYGTCLNWPLKPRHLSVFQVSRVDQRKRVSREWVNGRLAAGRPSLCALSVEQSPKGIFSDCYPKVASSGKTSSSYLFYLKAPGLIYMFPEEKYHTSATWVLAIAVLINARHSWWARTVLWPKVMPRLENSFSKQSVFYNDFFEIKVLLEDNYFILMLALHTKILPDFLI